MLLPSGPTNCWRAGLGYSLPPLSAWIVHGHFTSAAKSWRLSTNCIRRRSTGSPLRRCLHRFVPCASFRHLPRVGVALRAEILRACCSLSRYQREQRSCEIAGTEGGMDGRRRRLRRRSVAHAINLSRFTMIAHSHFASSPDDLEVHQQFLTPIVLEAALMLVISDRLDPSMGKVAKEQISELQLDSLLEEILPAVREMWGTRSTAEIVAATNGQLTGSPFSDVVGLRRVSWCSLGLDWGLSWDSGSVSDALAEEFAALAQIALTDLTSFELFVPPTSVELTLRAGSEWDLESVADNDRSRFVIQLPAARKHDNIGRTQAEAVAVVAYVLGTVSLAPTKSILSAIEESYKAGLPTNAFVGRSYASLFTDFYDTGRLKAWKNVNHLYAPPPVSITCVPELAWRADLLALVRPVGTRSYHQEALFEIPIVDSVHLRVAEYSSRVAGYPSGVAGRRIARLAHPYCTRDARRKLASQSGSR